MDATGSTALAGPAKPVAATTTQNVGKLDGREVTRKSPTDPDVAPVHGCCEVQCGNCGCRCTIL